jgi:calcineurin-like phosphoesterase family protein
MIFFTADTHFGHANIINYCGRPFLSKEEHDESLIENWNSVVSKRDVVYHLGDFGFGDPFYLKKVAQKLRGQINFIRGNHDGNDMLNILGNRFTFIKDSHLLETKVEGKNELIFLSHYPHRSWPRSYHGSWHLYGHVHGNLKYTIDHGLAFDVGVDVWNFTPIPIDIVHKRMLELKERVGRTI